MKLILRYCRELIHTYPLLFAKAIAMILLITALNTAIPCGMRYYIDAVTANGSILMIIAGLLLFAACMLLGTCLEIRWYIQLDEMGGRYITDITIDAEQVLAYASHRHVDEMRPDRLKHMLYADILDIFRVLGHHIPSLAGHLCTILISFLLAACFHWQFALILLLSSAGGFFLSFYSRKMISQKAGMTNQKLKTHHAHCNEYVDSLPLIQTNDIISYFCNRSKAGIHDFIEASQKENRTAVFWGKAIGNYNTLFTILLSALLVLPAVGGNIVNLVFFTMLSGIVTSTSQQAELLLQQIIKASVSFENIEAIRALPKRQGEQPLTHIAHVEFQNVVFTYPGAQIPALRDISCRLSQGDFIRLTGGNGSGKSTFIKLLTGIYAPDSGRILVNGQDLSLCRQEDLNRQILYINQDETMLNETMKTYVELISGHAIAPGEWGPLSAKAGLSAPSDRDIENNGLSLSVGQRKKLLILKLLLRAEEASVIILDEVEAGLDADTKARFLSILNDLVSKRDKIILMIEHTEEQNIPFDRVMEFGL